MTSSNGNGGSGASVRDPELDRVRLRAVHGALTAGDIAGAGKLAEDEVIQRAYLGASRQTSEHKTG